MSQGVAECPEFDYNVGHKDPFFDRIDKIFRMFYLLLLSCLPLAQTWIFMVKVYSSNSEILQRSNYVLCKSRQGRPVNPVKNSSRDGLVEFMTGLNRNDLQDPNLVCFAHPDIIGIGILE